MSSRGRTGKAAAQKAAATRTSFTSIEIRYVGYKRRDAGYSHDSRRQRRKVDAPMATKINNIKEALKDVAVGVGMAVAFAPLLALSGWVYITQGHWNPPYVIAGMIFADLAVGACCAYFASVWRAQKR